MSHQYKFQAKVWLYQGMAAWHFVTLPKELSAELKENFGDIARGWGSLPVDVKLGNTNWKTSIFPDKKIGAYILPLKLEVRKKEQVKEGDEITLILKIQIDRF